MANFQRNLAVVIGVNDYQNQVPKLKTAKNDAEVLAKLLTDSHQYEVTLITDETECKPTLDRLFNLLEKQLPEKINKDDRLLFYFAGHGIAKESDRGPAGFLVPQDADVKNQATLLPMQTLHDRLAALKCRHLLVILDCCFAGALQWSSTRLATVIPRQIHKEHYDRFINSPAWQAITSAAHNQEAYDINPSNRQTVPGTNHSPFAEALFKALQGEADIMPPGQKNQPPGDGVITATELSQYLQYQVAEIAGDRQTTQLWPLPKHNRGEYIFLHPDPKCRQPLKPAPELNKDNNPYRGLESFEEKHAQFFFGRQELIKKLEARISEPQRSLTVVLGVSGSGKSSLVKAGLIPCLKHLSKLEVFQINFVGAGILAEAIAFSLPQFFLKFLPLDYIHQWRILRPMRPGESPFAALARIILPITEIPISERLNSIDFLRELFQKRLEELNHKLNEFIDSEQESDEQLLLNQEREKFHKFATIWNNSNSRSKILLLVEEFEELYELCKEPEQQDTQTKETKQQEELRLTFLDCLNPLSQRLQSEHKQFVNIVQKWSKNYPGIKLLLVIDQFEELITLSLDEQKDKKSNKQPEWQQFLKLLEEVIAANLEQLRIVVTLRSDFEPRFLNSDALKSHWANARFPVRAMRSDELRQAIERPAAEMALYFEPPNLVDRLIDEVGQMPGALPLLSFTLSQFYIKLYESWKPGNTDRALRIDADFDKEGGVAGSLTRRANQEYNELPDDAHRDTMRRVMLRMVTLEGGEPVRRRVSLSELVYAKKQEPTQLNEEENQRVEVVLKHLDNARLVVRGEETGKPYVEPAHDFLVKGWDKLQKWLEKEQENLLLQRRLTTVAEEWKKKEQSTSVLGKAEPFLTSLDKKIDATGEWLKQIKEREVQEIIEKRQIQLQQAIGEWKSNEKVSNLLTKAEPFLKSLNKTFDFPEYWRTKIRPQNTQERPREKKVQFLWNGNPYLDVLRKTLKSRDYWFNQVEAEFVQQSIWQRRRNVNIRWGIATVVILGLIGLTSWALSEQQKAEIRQISTLRESAEALFLSNQELNALLNSLQAANNFRRPILKVLKPEHQLQTQVVQTLQKMFYGVREDNRWETPEGMTVQKMFFTLDGKLLIATTAKDNNVYLWDMKTKKLIAKLQGGNFQNNNIRFSPDGSKLATSDSKGFVYLWDLNGNNLAKFMAHPGGINKLSFSPNGWQLFTQGYDKKDFQPETTRLWNLGHNINLVKTFVNIIDFGFRSDGKQMIATQDKQGIKLWGLSSTPIPVPQISNSKGTLQITFSPDGKRMVFLGGGEGEESFSAQLWEWDGDKLQKVELSGIDAAQTASFSFDGKLLAIADDNTIRLYNEYSYDKPLSEFKLPRGRVRSMIFSHDGKHLATEGDDGTVRLWEVELPQPKEESEKYKFLQDGFQVISYSPDGKTVAGVNNNTIRLFNMNGHQLKEFVVAPGKVTSITFSSDSKAIATGSEKGIIRLFNLNGNLLNQFTAHQGSIRSVIISPNSQQLATIGNDGTASDKGEFYDGSVARLWTLKGEKLGEYTAFVKSVKSIDFQPNSGKLAIVTVGKDPVDMDTVFLSDISGGKPNTLIPGRRKGGNYYQSITWSPDGSLLATATSGGDISIFDLQGRKWLEFKGAECNSTNENSTEEQQCINSISFSADGSTLALITRDGNAKFWQLGRMDDLVEKGCARVREYLAKLDEKDSIRTLCDSFGNPQP